MLKSGNSWEIVLVEVFHTIPFVVKYGGSDLAQGQAGTRSLLFCELAKSQQHRQ